MKYRFWRFMRCGTRESIAGSANLSKQYIFKEFKAIITRINSYIAKGGKSLQGNLKICPRSDSQRIQK